SWRGAAALLAVSALSCGGDATQETTGAAWQAPEKSGAARLNRAPVILEVRLSPSEPAAGERVSALVRASEPDGEAIQLRFTWSIGGRTLPDSGAEIRLGEVARGARIEVEVTASDGRDEGEPVWASGTVRNRRPVVTGIGLRPLAEVPRGEPVVATVAARDPDGDPLEFRYEWSVNDRPLPEEGNTLRTDRLRRGDAIRVRVAASDGIDESAPIPSGVVHVANAHPEILSSPSGVSSDGSFRYAVQVRDPDGDRNLRYELRKGPEGMKMNRIDGEVTWQATAKQAGAHAVEIVVEDSEGARTVQAFELVVRVADPQPAAAPAR
ncbi:MAG: hypothetical protein JRS35_22545, partial [Deltaproteobacteria bacterium]|nr:hypothetical protein [Deltaproteobacteria bacterium]